MSEVFKIQNISLGSIALIDFGLIIPPNEIVELGNFDQTLLSPQLDSLLNDGTLVRLINDVSVAYSEAFTSTTQIYNFDSSTIDGSINKLFSQDLTINASLGIRPLTTYVDGSLNLKVNRTLFDSSILSLTNKNISQDASIILRPLTTYVDGSLNLKVNRTLFDSSIAALTLKNTNQDSSIAAISAAIVSKVYGSEYQLAADLTTTSTSSTTEQPKVTMTTTNLPAGTYKILANWTWSRNSASNSARFNVTIGGVAQGTRSQLELEAGDTTDIRSEVIAFYVVLSGVNTIVLNYWGESGANSTTISDATIELIRVA